MDFKNYTLGVVGAGAMGSGIAQVAATAGHKVVVYDSFEGSVIRAKENLLKGLNSLVEKGKIDTTKAESIKSNIVYTSNIKDLAHSNLIIEAIVEELEIKKKLFIELETLVSSDCILASNTSSLSIASISGACKNKERVVGIHFFNPATIMPLVEIIPSLSTSENVTKLSKSIIDSWNKVTVLAKDSPGFIVNRLARCYYSEAIRISEEGIADYATIDWAMKTIGGFKMGPFELMDFIGNDVNYRVTESVWTQFFYEPRFKPSLTQKRLFESGNFGRKTGKGYYDYSQELPKAIEDKELAHKIFERVMCMLFNEAIDAFYLRLALRADLDTAMIKGVNYPKGLLQWAEDFGVVKTYEILNGLYNEYQEERYRPCVLLKRLAKINSSEIHLE